MSNRARPFVQNLPLALALVLLVATTASCTSRTASHSASSGSGSTGSRTSAPAESDAQRATDAYVWGYPLVVTERTLQSLARLTPVNHLTFQAARSGVTTRTIVAPNTDTLYAVAPLDLRGEPYVLTLPAIHDRYYSFQLISAYTDSFAYVGTRATGGRAGRWAITPPGWHGRLPAGVTRVASPTPQLLLLGRFLVADDADVVRVHALAGHIELQPLSKLTGAAPAAAPPPIGAPAGTPQTVAAAGLGFFDELGDALAINPPIDAQERRTLQSFAVLGIGPGRHPSTQVHDPRLRSELVDAVRQGTVRITAAAPKSTNTVDGWTVNLHIGTYGHDALLRAVVAEIGWGANVPAEAVYAHSERDAAGASYSGARRYVLHFPRGGLPPVDAFWSVTMYGPDRFFIANPINRYAIGDRTAGLRYGTDGSLDIYIQRAVPAGHESNWLPAPAGRFILTMRLYLPKTSVLDGQYEYPKVAFAPPS
jgi:hypothetical protein